MRWGKGVAVGLALAVFTSTACADEAEAPPPPSAVQYQATLLRFPVDESTVAQRRGVGTVEANVVDGTLVIAGTYAELESPATSSELHRARLGLRGEPVADLAHQGALEGTISGSLPMDDALLEALRLGELYVTLGTSSFPEGALRGWLTGEEAS